MQLTGATTSSLIKDVMMNNNNCEFEIARVTVKEVECLLKKCQDRPPGVNSLDLKFLSTAANLIAVPVCHIVTLSTKKCICLPNTDYQQAYRSRHSTCPALT